MLVHVSYELIISSAIFVERNIHSCYLDSLADENSGINRIDCVAQRIDFMMILFAFLSTKNFFDLQYLVVFRKCFGYFSFISVRSNRFRAIYTELYHLLLACFFVQ